MSLFRRRTRVGAALPPLEEAPSLREACGPDAKAIPSGSREDMAV